jgi:hypothetical protein
MILEILWSPDSKAVVFTTGCYLIITNVEKFNIYKINLQPEWWKWNKESGGTFSSAGKKIIIEKAVFIHPDTLEFKTNIMSDPVKVCVGDI